DPAIWRNPADPDASLIVATDKKAGLHVYGLDGKSRFFDAAGRLNNVDLAELGEQGVIVVASDRNNETAAKLRLYRLDTGTARLVPLGTVQGGAGEAYGVCVWAADDGLHAYSVLKDGTVEEYRLELDGTARALPLLTRKLATQAEGCVVDPRDGTLYVGEEDVGIWKFAAGSADGALVARADGLHLVADVEGLAIMPAGEAGGWLIASSQGDNAYALYSLPDLAPAGRFRIGAGRFGSTEETDGIAVAGGSFGAAYPDGLFVAQDGQNAPYAQNFKLVSWAAILAALQP
ncbi:MAG: phytase, partial [Novosphingobium sp.]|nr:phytase [Novosphingobium sp.]